ncbi:extracellular solute-binding protein [Candidatus Hydrogenedentota bacterium]
MLVGLCFCLLVERGPSYARAEERETTTITFWDLNPGTNRTPYREYMVNDFEEKNPDIKVDYVRVPYSASVSKVVYAIQAGNPPDCSLIMSGWVAQFVAMGGLEDLEPYIANWEHKNEIDETALEIDRESNGRASYMPTTMGADALYYRKDWFDRDGIKPPTTWEELVEVAKFYTKPKENQYGLAIRGGHGGSTYTYYFMVAALGKEVFDKNGICRLNEPEAVEGLQFYCDLVNEYKVTQPTGVTDGYRELVGSFSSGVTAMYIHNNGSIGDQLRKFKDKNKFMTARLPAGPRGSVSTIGCNGYVIYSSSKKKEAAWRLISHFVTREMQVYYCKNTGAYPANKLAQQDSFFTTENPYYEAFFYPGAGKALKAHAPLFLPGIPNFQDQVMTSEVQNCLMGKTSVQEAADTIAEGLTREYQSWLKRGGDVRTETPKNGSLVSFVVMVAGVGAVLVIISRMGGGSIETVTGRKTALPYMLLLPAFMMIATFKFYPIAKTFFLSTQYYVMSDLKNQHYIGLESFRRAFGDAHFWSCLGHSFVWVFASVSLQFASGLGVALLLNNDFKGRGVYRAIVLCPWALSGVVVELMWSWMFHGQIGVINDMLLKAGIISEHIAWLAHANTALAAVIIANVWRGMPFFAVTLLAALQTIPPEMYEAADVDGGGRFAKFRHITMPMIRDMVFVTVLLRSIWTFNNVDLIYTMTKGGPGNSTQTLATYIFTRATSALDMGYGAALAVILFFILMACIVIVFKAGNYNKEATE